MSKTIKAIGLLSGGLDSSLAVKIMHNQGIHVHAVNFHTGFCFADTRRADRRKDKDKPVSGGASDAKSAVAGTDIPLEVVDISKGYLEVIHHPQYGYGKNVNPCVDCRIHMFSLARDMMEQYEADFVFTGEVLGQRPKSQHMKQLGIVAEQSGLGDRLLRPLSAQLLPETLPEREGWVDRDKLFGFHGRNRKPQMELAAELGIDGYPQPAGGCCFLTDPAYGRRVKDLWQNSIKDELEWDDYLLLKTGRHLRVKPDLKVIVGRDEGENMFLEQYAKFMIQLEPIDINGPVTVVDRTISEEDLMIAARLTACYSSHRNIEDAVNLVIRDEKTERTVSVKPFSREEANKWLIM